MRWIGWAVVAVVLAAMTFARLTDDAERKGRSPDWEPAPHELPRSDAAAVHGEASPVHGPEAVSETL